MSLTEGLLIVAAVVLAVLLGHGVWSSWRARPRTAEPQGPEATPTEGKAPLRESGSAGRVEPMLGPLDGLSGPGEAAQAAQAPGAMGQPLRPSHGPDSGPGAGTARAAQATRAERADAAGFAESAGSVGRTGVPLPSGVRLRPQLSDLIDALVTMPLEAPVAAEAALAFLPSTRRAGSKPMMIEGLNAESGRWELPHQGQRYSEFQAGVQLANRAGAINQIEYSEFVQKVQSFAEGIGSECEFEDMLEVVNRARELDTFANNHDAQLAVHLRTAGVAWSLGYLQQVASRHGLVAGVMAGRLVLPSDEEEGPPLVVLAFDQQAALAEDPNSAALNDVTLMLDVPQTAEALQPFERWQQLAVALANELDAQLMDDEGRVINPQQFAAIDADLKRLYKSLESRDLPAGSMAARRLFS